MQPTYTPDAEAYREKVQAFLAEKLPSNWTGAGSLEGEALTDFVAEWRKVLYEANYLAPGWPAEYGGAERTFRIENQFLNTEHQQKGKSAAKDGRNHPTGHNLADLAPGNGLHPNSPTRNL